MKIYTFFDPNHRDPARQVEELRVFVRTWEANGWTVHVVTPRMIRHVDEKLPTPIRILRAMRGRWFAELYRDNPGFTPARAQFEVREMKRRKNYELISGLCYLPR